MPTNGSRKGDWIATFTGRAFWPLDPRPEDVVIEDIAHALSMLCRYGGHCRRFYCPTPDQRVLTADLRWIPAGDLEPGDELLAFDELPRELGSAGKRRRRFRPAVVALTRPVKRRVIRLEMADGSTVVSSAEHPWLVATKTSRNQKWVTADDIASALFVGRRRYMHRFFTPWTEIGTRRAGWLAGIYDGEGYLSLRNRSGVQMGVAQNPGAVLIEIGASLASFGFPSLRYSSVGSASVQNVQLGGGWREMARLLGSIRPLRLLEKFATGLHAGHFNKQLDGQGEPTEIVRAYIEGEKWVSGIETSTHTYFCEGFGAHNSVAEHSIHISRRVPPQDALWGLLHDASEAYLIDLPRPIKHQIPEYRRHEANVMACIAERFRLPKEEPASVSRMDKDIIHDERAALMPEMKHLPWRWGGRPHNIVIRSWTPAAAERNFLARFHTLMRLRASQKEAA